MQIGQLSRQVVDLPSLIGGFMGNTIYNPKNKICKDLESRFDSNTSLKEEEIMEKVKVENEKKVSENTKDYMREGSQLISI